ncbi:MAG TPA: C45 family peptidase [Thermoanaerobaculia bacterium]|nr:C45 family peptidase [Thermoanaerobaculia bacterium]
MSTTRPELFVAGVPYEIGVQYGNAMAAEIDRFLHDGLARINRLRDTPLSAAAVSKFVGESAFWIEKEIPAIAEQVSGLAAGAGITYEQAMSLQLRRELIRHPREAGDCTSIAHVGNGRGPLIAQNVDLVGDLSELSLVLHVESSDASRPKICLLTFVGLCAYLGINSHGLAVGINMVTSAGWRAGVPPYLLVGHILGCSSIAEALDELARIRRASSRYFVLADPGEAVGVEMTVTDLRILRAPLLAHANHFLHPDLQSLETKSGAELACSHDRLQRIASLAARGVDAQEMLGDHDGFPNSICVHNNGDLREIETVAGVVMVPRNRELRIAFGHPCRSEFRAYTAVAFPS